MGAGEQPAIGREVLRRIGLEALVDLLETTSYGVAITGDDHTWVYLNPAGERIFGRPLAEVAGRDYLLHFPEREREVLLALEQRQREGDTEFYTNTVVQPDGSEREMTWSGTVIEVDGTELAPAIFHETTEVRGAQRMAARLAASRSAGRRDSADADRDGLLQALVEHTTELTRACGALLVLENDAGSLEVTVSAGADPGFGRAVAAHPAVLSDLPATADLARGRSVLLSDAADRLAANPSTEDWVRLVSAEPWSGAAMFPTRCDGELAGCLMVLLPRELTSPSESELATWSALADQVGIVLGAERMRQHVSLSSAMLERSRIARDLHDSVSQAVFSLHARAQVIRRALDRGDPALAREAAEDLEMLSRQASAELRELVGGLRRTAAPTRDLGAELRRIAADVQRVEGLPVEVSVSPADLPPVPADLAEHVARVVGEALHNSVKHAAATGATVAATLGGDDEGGRLDVRVVDDGRGFDPATTGLGFGQHTMRERAELVGGRLSVQSSPGRGTTVRLSVPLAGSAPAAGA